MTKIPFNEAELVVQGTVPGQGPGAGMPRFTTPITPKENLYMALRGETPCWVPLTGEAHSINPRILPDNVCRGFVNDLEEPELTIKDYGGIGWFNTKWVFEELVNGATTEAGQKQLEDINDWKTLEFPDVDSYDWARSAEINKGYFNRDYIAKCTMFTGFWERLMAVMDVTDAAMSLIDEDCEDAIHEFFDALADLYIKTLGHMKEAYGIECVTFHDDWGTQHSQFFSVETNREMVAPHMKKVADWCHENGIIFELHSCGLNEKNVPVMIEIGVDMWNGQPMNDKCMLAHKYGDQILIGVDAPEVPADVPEAEARAKAQAFWESIKDCRCMVNPRYAPNKYFLEELYKLSREYYASIG